MSVQPHLRIAARHQALYRAAVAAKSKPSAITSMRICSAGDVRLTMGGEPTFVSIDDPDGAEWTTAAFGPNKRKLAVDLLPQAARPLRPRRPAALRPGQMVSRRAAPALGARLLLAQRRRPHLGRPDPHRRRRQGLRLQRRRRAPAFCEALTRRLQVDDSVHHAAPTKTSSTTCGRNAGCRSTSIRSIPNWKIPSSARRLARVFEQGLGKTVGYVLPLRRVPTRSGAPRWTSQPWFLAVEADCFSSPAIRPSAIACRSNRCPGPSRKTSSYTYDPDPFANARRTARKARHASPHLFTRTRPPDDPAEPAARPAAKPPEKGESAAVGRAPRPLRPAARRQAVRLHAAGRVSGGLSRPGRRHRRHRRASQNAGR